MDEIKNTFLALKMIGPGFVSLLIELTTKKYALINLINSRILGIPSLLMKDGILLKVYNKI